MGYEMTRLPSTAAPCGDGLCDGACRICDPELYEEEREIDDFIPVHKSAGSQMGNVKKETKT